MSAATMNALAAYMTVGLFFASYVAFTAIGNPFFARQFSQLEVVAAFIVVLAVWPLVLAELLGGNGRWKQ